MSLRITTVRYGGEMQIDAEIWDVGRLEASATMHGMLAYLVAFAPHFGVRVNGVPGGPVLEDLQAGGRCRHQCRLSGGASGTTLHMRATATSGQDEAALRDFLDRIAKLFEAHGHRALTFAEHLIAATKDRR